MYDNYPLDSKTTGDGQGGVWVLKEDTLSYANLQRQKLCWYYPETSDLEGDGQGGVWIFCKSNGTYGIWHATCPREVQIYTCPKRLKLASDGQGGLWTCLFLAKPSPFTNSLHQRNWYEQLRHRFLLSNDVAAKKRQATVHIRCKHI